jgi:hypothetical protein
MAVPSTVASDRLIHSYALACPMSASLPIEVELRDLEFGQLYRFSDWPNAAVPSFGAGVYTIWQGRTLIYVGMSGRSIEADTAKRDRPHGLFTRLKSHADGRRSGDQFCVYVADRLLLSVLSRAQIAEIAAGSLNLDRLIRSFIHEHLEYRFVVLPTGSQARSIEVLVRNGALQAGKPLLNPRVQRVAGQPSSSQ